jgi:hypothetical protein
MISYPIHTDIVKIIELQTEALRTLADANEVTLIFQSTFQNFKLEIQPEIVITDFVQLLSKVIIFTPQEHEVTISLALCDGEKFMKLNVFADGALIVIPEQALSMLQTDVVISSNQEEKLSFQIFTKSFVANLNPILQLIRPLKKRLLKSARKMAFY